MTTSLLLGWDWHATCSVCGRKRGGALSLYDPPKTVSLCLPCIVFALPTPRATDPTRPAAFVLKQAAAAHSAILEAGEAAVAAAHAIDEARIALANEWTRQAIPSVEETAAERRAEVDHGGALREMLERAKTEAELAPRVSNDGMRANARKREAKP